MGESLVTSGIQSKGVDLDAIFAAYVSGAHPAATGIEVAGVDVATRYQPLPGTSAPATGILSKGADLNTLFSTTSGAEELPFNGSAIISNGTNAKPTPSNGSAVLNLTTTEWTSNSSNQYTSGPLPAGSASAECTFGSYSFTGPNGQFTTSNPFSSRIALTSSENSISLTVTGVATGTAGSGVMPATLNIYSSSGVVIATASFNFQVSMAA